MANPYSSGLPLLWKKIPTYWLQDEVAGIQSFDIKNELGASTAALMTLCALCLRASPLDEPSRGEPSYSTKATLSELQEILGISRKLTLDGLILLEQKRIISIQKKGRNNLYLINGLNEKKEFGRLPHRFFMSIDGHIIRGIFRNFELRSKNAFNALALYLTLIQYATYRESFKKQGKNRERLYIDDPDLAKYLDKQYGTAISYDVIQKRTGLRREDIRIAISILESNKLIYCDKIKSKEVTVGTAEEVHGQYHGRRFNFYQVRGMDSTRGMQRSTTKKCVHLEKPPEDFHYSQDDLPF